MVEGASSSRPRVRPGLRRLLYWIAPALVLIAAWQIWDGVEARRFAREVARVFPAGSAETRKQRPMRPDDAASYYEAVNVAALGRAAGDRSWERLERARTALEQGGVIATDDADALARMVANFDLPLRLVRDAGGRPYYGDAPFVLESAYRFTGLQPTGQAAGAETLLLIAAGETAKAVDSLMARVRFLRAYDADRRSFAVFAKSTEMTGIARDVAVLLRAGPLPEPGLAALDDALAEAYHEDEIALALLAEARFAVPFLDGRMFAGPRMAFLRLAFASRPALRHVGVDVMKTVGDALGAASLPWPERLHALDRVEDRETPILGRMFALPWRVSRQARIIGPVAAAGMAAARATRGVLAIERQRAEGPAPATLLDALQNGDRAAYIDPFSGESLRLVRDDAGYVVYSIGRDFRDDGGNLTPDPPGTRAPGSVPPRDIGIRVAYRRAAAATNASNNSRNSPVR